MDLTRLGDGQQQEIELLQRFRHLRKKAAAAPTGLRRHACGAVGRLVIVVEDKPPEGVIECAKGQCWWAMRLASRGIARQIGEETLVDRGKEALHPSSPARFAGQREHQPNFEISTDLFDMPGGEITAVIGVQDRRNPAHGPARFALAPDGLMQRQGCLQAAGALNERKYPAIARL